MTLAVALSLNYQTRTSFLSDSSQVKQSQAREANVIQNELSDNQSLVHAQSGDNATGTDLGYFSLQKLDHDLIAAKMRQKFGQEQQQSSSAPNYPKPHPFPKPDPFAVKHPPIQPDSNPAPDEHPCPKVPHVDPYPDYPEPPEITPLSYDPLTYDPPKYNPSVHA